MLQLLVERIIREYVNDAHEVDVLFVCREEATLVLLVKALMVLKITTALQVIGN